MSEITFDYPIFDLLLDDTKFEIVFTGPPGPPGADGNPGPAGTTDVTFIAGEAISGHSLVILEGPLVYAASSQDLSNFGRVIGLTTGATIESDSVLIITRGPITEPSWNWTLNQPIYLAVNGSLTATEPSIGAGDLFAQKVGFATGSDSIYLDLSVPIHLT